MSDRKKHRILTALFSKYQIGEENSGHGHEVTELGRSMTNIQIHNDTGIDIRQVDNLCYSLSNQGHLTILKKDENNKAHRYLITQSGQQAVTDKAYLNTIWYRKQSFWFQLITVLIAVFTFIWTIYIDSSHSSEIEKLQAEIDSLKASIEKQK